MKIEKLIDVLKEFKDYNVEIYCGGKLYTIKSIYENTIKSKKYVVLAATQPKDIKLLK